MTHRRGTTRIRSRRQQLRDAYENICRIDALLAEAGGLLAQMPDGIRRVLLGYHPEGYTLHHCLYWGMQAAGEIRGDWDGVAERWRG